MSKQYIDKNKVIIALSHNKCGNDENDIAVQTCIETIKKLPTVELISREEVLNLLDTAFENGAFDGRYAYENLVDAVQNLIHPLETKALEQQPCDDVISRQEAIRVAEQGQIQGYVWQFKKLRTLPPATSGTDLG